MTDVVYLAFTLVMDGRAVKIDHSAPCHQD